MCVRFKYRNTIHFDFKKMCNVVCSIKSFPVGGSLAEMYRKGLTLRVICSMAETGFHSKEKAREKEILSLVVKSTFSLIFNLKISLNN